MKQKHILQYMLDDKSSQVLKYLYFPLTHETKFDFIIRLQLYTNIKYRMLDISFILKPKDLPNVIVWTEASTSYGAGGFSTNLNYIIYLGHH